MAHNSCDDLHSAALLQLHQLLGKTVQYIDINYVMICHAKFAEIRTGVLSVLNVGNYQRFLCVTADTDYVIHNAVDVTKILGLRRNCLMELYKVLDMRAIVNCGLRSVLSEGQKGAFENTELVKKIGIVNFRKGLL